MQWWRRRRRSLPPSICPLPWQNLSLDVDGSSRPCCKFAHLEEGSAYQLANLREADLDGVWNSEAMRQLRRDFRAGERPSECRTCWDEEAAGIESLRQMWHKRGLEAPIDYDDTAPSQPVALDLKLSNACNLKCRICGPVASSLWLSEQLALDPEDRFLADNRRYFLSNKITNQDDAQVFRRWLPDLEHVEMTGGEPMFSAENREVIDLIVAEGRPERVWLLLTTNATVVDERIVAHLPRFRRVSLSLSIDDIGQRLEYERSPANWETVASNVRRYAAMVSSQCDVWINCSVSALNVWYLPEYVEWLVGDERHRGINLHLNLVHNDRHFNIQHLPPELKVTIRERLAALARRRGCPRSVRNQVEDMIEFLAVERPEDGAVWRDFIRHTQERDRIRGQSFAVTFPELFAELERLDLWAPAPAPVTIRDSR